MNKFQSAISKASSVLTIKSFNEDEGILRGFATTPKADRDGDVIVPEGAMFELPLPLLFNHDQSQPIGHVIEATVTKAGIEIVAKVAKDATAKIAEVWQLIKSGLVSGFSVGFRALDAQPIPTGLRFNKWNWLELSAVTVPANTEAAIRFVKSVSINPPKVNILMSISEQIQQFQAKKADLVGRMDAMITKGATLSPDEDAQYKSIEGEVIAIDQHIDRLKAAEARQAKSAKPVAGVATMTVESNAPKGQDFTRFVKSVALARGNAMQAAEIAKHAYPDSQRVHTVLKAAIAAGSTDSVAFSVLTEAQTMEAEFIDLLRPATIVGQLPGLRQVPANIRLPKATSGTSASWVGEGKAAPITNAAFGDLEIGFHKVAAIAVFTEELLRHSSPSAEALVRDDLIGAVAQAVDVAFIDPANAGVAGAKPASITNGADADAATGTNAAAVRADVANAYGKFIAANHPLNSGVWVMNPSTALALSMMRNAQGAPEFPGITMNGGTFEGLPVVVSTNVPGDAVNGYTVALAVQNDILVADEGGIAIDASREVSLEMDTAPLHDSKTPTGASLVSMWQTGSVAIKAVRPITWNRRRPTAVAVITGTKYA